MFNAYKMSSGKSILNEAKPQTDKRVWNHRFHRLHRLYSITL